MARRIKVTGYITPEDLDSQDVDLEHPSGLTEEGYLNLVAGENGKPLTLTALEDVDTSVVDS